MRALLPLAACLVLAACGSSAEGAGTEPPPRPAPGPSDSPPAGEGEAEPPPAWVETEAGAFWLAYSSFCWTNLCVDYVAAADREDLPRIPVRAGERIRFHLGFRADALALHAPGGDSVELDPADPVWIVDGAGPFSLFALAAAGEDGADASYAAVLETGP